MRKISLFIIAAIFLISAVKAEVIISEIMYAPTFNEDYNEWIEIYNSGSENISLSDWKLCNIDILPGYADYRDNGAIKEDNGLILKAGEYAVISDGDKNGTDAYNNLDIVGLALHTNAASTCGGLTNKGKEISISYNNETKSVIYDNKTGGLKNNMSLQFVNDEWCEGIPTPGEPNECFVEDIGHDLEDNSTENTVDNETVQNNQTVDNETIADENKTEIQLATNAVSEPKTEAKISGNNSSNNSSLEKKKVIYQSKSDRIKGTALYLSAGLFILLFLYLIKTKNL
jgi:hypothetical protein